MLIEERYHTKTKSELNLNSSRENHVSTIPFPRDGRTFRNIYRVA